MTNFHAVMSDETGCEFGVGVQAATREEAYEKLRENYPESNCVQLESPEDTRERERRMYARIEAEMNGDFYDDPEWEYEQECRNNGW